MLIVAPVGEHVRVDGGLLGLPPVRGKRVVRIVDVRRVQMEHDAVGQAGEVLGRVPVFIRGVQVPQDVVGARAELVLLARRRRRIPGVRIEGVPAPGPGQDQRKREADDAYPLERDSVHSSEPPILLTHTTHYSKDTRCSQLTARSLALFTHAKTPAGAGLDARGGLPSCNVAERCNRRADRGAPAPESGPSVCSRLAAGPRCCLSEDRAACRPTGRSPISRSRPASCRASLFPCR
jgi:hypothetical protein